MLCLFKLPDIATTFPTNGVTGGGVYLINCLGGSRGQGGGGSRSVWETWLDLVPLAVKRLHSGLKFL